MAIEKMRDVLSQLDSMTSIDRQSEILEVCVGVHGMATHYICVQSPEDADKLRTASHEFSKSLKRLVENNLSEWDRKAGVGNQQQENFAKSTSKATYGLASAPAAFTGFIGGTAGALVGLGTVRAISLPFTIALDAATEPFNEAGHKTPKERLQQVTPVHQQQIATVEQIEVLEQHLPFVLVNAVQGCCEHQFGPRQVQAEGNLVGRRDTRNMAGAMAKPQRRGVCGDQSESMPKRHKAQGTGLPYQPGVERGYSGRIQFGACTGKGALGDVAHRLGPLLEMGEKFIKFSLDTLAHATQKHGQQRGQGQFPVTSKGVGKIRMPCRIAELAGMQVFGKGEEQLLQHGGQ